MRRARIRGVERGARLVPTDCAYYGIDAACIPKNMARMPPGPPTAPYERHMLKCGRAPHTAKDVAVGTATPFSPPNSTALYSYRALGGSILGKPPRNEDKKGETQPHAPREQASARRLQPSY